MLTLGSALIQIGNPLFDRLVNEIVDGVLASGKDADSKLEDFEDKDALSLLYAGAEDLKYGSLDQARQNLNRAVVKKDGCALPHLLVACVKWRLRDFAGAEISIGRAFARNPFLYPQFVDHVISTMRPYGLSRVRLDVPEWRVEFDTVNEPAVRIGRLPTPSRGKMESECNQ